MKLKIADYFSVELILIVLSLILFFYQYNNFTGLYFDEFHYVPAAKDLVSSLASTNLEHPPLGKIIIGMSIRIFGDGPLGWRAPSILFGMMTIILFFKIAQNIFRDHLTAFLVGLLALTNIWIYIQSRIAMLDIFLLFFLLLGIYFYLKSREKKSFVNDILCFGSFGFATAVKWNAIFIFFPTIIFYFYENRKVATTLILILFSIVLYYLTFIPIYLSWKLNYSIQYIIFELPFEMLRLQKSVIADHPYKSKWYTWPLMIRPIWYEYIKDSTGNYFRGVILLGNPLQMLLGFFAVIYMIFKLLIKKINYFELYFIFLFLCSWLVWALVPRGLQFFYYFFIPASLYALIIPIWLSEMISVKRLNLILGIMVIISTGFFIYFYPVISGNLTPEVVRLKWAWLNSWI